MPNREEATPPDDRTQRRNHAPGAALPIDDDTIDVPRDAKALANKLDPIVPLSAVTSANGTFAARGTAASRPGVFYSTNGVDGVFYSDGVR